MARSSSFGREETVATRADRDGRYSLRVYPRSHRAESIPYILELGVTTADDRCENDRGMEPNDTRNQAEDLDSGRYRDLMLCFEDEDWYELELNEGDEFELRIDFDNDVSDMDLRLYQPGRFNAWMSSTSRGRDRETLEGAAEQAGAHLLQVFGEEGAYELLFELEACEPDNREPNDDHNRAEDLRAGTYRDLTHCGQNEDWYAVDLDEGDDIIAEISFRSADGNLDLHLYEPFRNATPADRSEGFGSSEEVSWRAERDGEHLLRVFTDDRDGANVEYDLEIEVVEAADRCGRDNQEPNDSRNSARSVRDGTLRNLTLCGDEDWYRIDADEGDELSFEIRYDAISRNAHIDVELFDPANRRVETDRGSGGRADVEHDVQRDGRHSLRVYARPADAELEYQLITDLR